MKEKYMSLLKESLIDFSKLEVLKTPADSVVNYKKGELATHKSCSATSVLERSYDYQDGKHETLNEGDETEIPMGEGDTTNQHPNIEERDNELKTIAGDDGFEPNGKQSDEFDDTIIDESLEDIDINEFFEESDIDLDSEPEVKADEFGPGFEPNGKQPDEFEKSNVLIDEGEGTLKESDEDLSKLPEDADDEDEKSELPEDAKDDEVDESLEESMSLYEDDEDADDEDEKSELPEDAKDDGDTVLDVDAELDSDDDDGDEDELSKLPEDAKDGDSTAEALEESLYMKENTEEEIIDSLIREMQEELELDLIEEELDLDLDLD